MIQNRIWNKVPSQLLDALEKFQGRFTDPVHIFHCLCVQTEMWVGVFGDGDNGAYETFVWTSGKLTCSDVGWGDTALALKDVLNRTLAE